MSKLHILCTASTFALFAVAGLSPTAALAQDDVTAAATDDDEVIFVTAQRRDELQVDVPISVTSLDEEQLETANVETLADISKITPALRFDNQSQFAQPSIRGIGTSITTSGGGANVGIYIDGFYSPNPVAADTELLNVRSIQVLKGPQGTLFGRNTTGGAILIETEEPSEETRGEFTASYQRFDRWRGQGYVTTGLAPGLAVDLEGMYERGEAFQKNIVATGPQDFDYENWSVRAGLRMQFSDDVSALIRYQHTEINDPRSLLTNLFVDPVVGRLGIQIPGLFTSDPDLVAIDLPTFFRTTNDIAQLTIEADLGFANLTSYSQYRREDSDASSNLDQVGFTAFQLGLPVYDEHWSQEFLLNSKPGTPLQYTAGLFYFSSRDQYLTFIDNFGPSRAKFGPTRLGGSSTTTQSYAGFLDLTYEITPRLFVTAGARVAHDQVVDAYFFAGPVLNPLASIESDTVTPRAVIRYKPNEDSSIYASYARGYKAAIIDAGGTCQNPVNIPTPQNPTGAGFTCNDVKPETVDAFEVGYKFDNGPLSAEVAAFYYDYKNLQVSLFLAGRANILNAASSEIYGAEAAVHYDFSDAFEINAGASWTHARYKNFPLAPIYGPTGVTLTPLTDVTMQHTPEFTGNIGARYTADIGGGELALSGNLYYTSSFFFGPSGIQFPQKGYELLSLRAEWTDPSDTFTLAVFGDNVTDNRYVSQVQYNTIGVGSVWADPATYGVEVGVRF